MRIRRAWLGLCLGWPLIAGGEEPIPAPGPEDVAGTSAGDVTDVIEYMEGKFGIPERELAARPPGTNDLVAADGRIFRNAQVWKQEPDGLTLRHDEGLTKLEFPQLPEDWRTKYGYDPEAAAAYRQAVAEAIQAAERAQQALREQMAAERAKQSPE